MITRLLAALLVLATPAAAFDGRYGDCAVTFGEGVPIRIEGDVIAFYESECRMTNPTLVRDMDGAVLFDLVCQGEGETWTERAFLQRTADAGLILVWRGTARTLPYCP